MQKARADGPAALEAEREKIVRDRKCPSGHDLELKVVDELDVCDVCLARCVVGSKELICEACCFVVCERCFSRQLSRKGA